MTFSPVDTPPAPLGGSRRRRPSFPARDRAEATARLLAELHACDDEHQQAALWAEVVVINMGLARTIAHRYGQRGLPEDDLVQVAYIGLMKAVNGFDPTRQRDFLCYALPTIAGEVKRHFREFGWTVRPPRRVQELQGQVAARAADLTQRLGRSPTPSEVARDVGVDVEAVIEALACNGAFTPASLDMPVQQDGGTTLGDLVKQDGGELDSAEARVVLGPLVRTLAPRDRRILELRFFRGWTQEDIAQDIGVSQVQVSRLLARILRDLRAEVGEEAG